MLVCDQCRYGVNNSICHVFCGGSSERERGSCSIGRKAEGDCGVFDEVLNLNLSRAEKSFLRKHEHTGLKLIIDSFDCTGDWGLVCILHVVA